MGRRERGGEEGERWGGEGESDGRRSGERWEGGITEHYSILGRVIPYLVVSIW